ncbi:ATP-binding protein [Dawidia soli]|uniref:histidine kinase n=1 Tax=Dawidia soli TaxID=2782352 RepID=A0AAP2DAQ4_9BACT|nr:tetratricopeptide repeat protein [Dawidia soli]MBT1688067.1 tetratricopeptide repeat protein [Dawidia soli]
MIALTRQLYRAGQYDEALKNATEARVISRAMHYPKGEGNAWIGSGQAYLRMGDYDSALAHFHKGHTAFTEANELGRLADTYLYIGQAYDHQARYKEANEQYRAALAVLDSHPNEDMRVRVLNSMGITYFNRGSYDLAQEYYLQGMKISATFADRLYYATLVNNLGVVKMATTQYDEALRYFRLYRAAAREMNDLRSEAVALLNIGEAFIGLKQYKEANQHLDSALIKYGQMGDKRGMSFAEASLGDSYRNMGWFLNAETYYQESIRIAREIHSDEALVKSLLGLTDLYIRRQQPRRAAAPLEEVKAAAERSDAMPWMQKVYLYSSRLDSARGNYQSAYQWFKEYSHLKDSLFNERKSQQVAQMQELYESEKKDKEIALLSEAKKMEELKLSSNKKLLIISVIFFVLLTGLILYWGYIKSRYAREVSEQHERISEAYEELKVLMDRVEEQNKMLATKNEALEELHREKDGLIGVVAHDLRSPLNRIAGLATLVEMGQSLNDEGKELVGIMQKVCSEGNGLIRDLLEINQYEHHEALTLVPLNVGQFVDTLAAHYTGALEKKQLTMVLRNDPDSVVQTDSHCLNRIIDNILTNAIKFSPPGRSIYIDTEAQPAAVTLRIRDEGPGFHPDDLSRVFRKFTRLSARPTGGESSTGLGLSIVKTLVEKLHGTITLESVWGAGATFVITLPRNA